MMLFHLLIYCCGSWFLDNTTAFEFDVYSPSMVLEEQQRNSSCNSNSRSKSKKVKKIPQRGLGVAQLEKLRIEELKKKSSAASSSSTSLPSFVIPPSPPKQPCLPFTPSLDTSHPFSVSATIDEFMHQNSPAIAPVADQSKQIDPTDALGTTNFGPRFLLPSSNLSSKGWRYDPPQRSQYYQQPSPIQSFHNSALPSSGVSIQMEPPSNQIYSSTFVKPSGWPEEERNLDSNSQWHPLAAFTTLARKSPLTSPFLYSSDPPKFEMRNTGFREDVLSSGTHPIDQRNSDGHISKRLRESRSSTLTDEGFLTLGSSIPMSRHADFSLFPSHVGINHGGSGLAQCVDNFLPSPFYNFFPPAPANTSELNSKDGSGEASNGVDTDLKLG